MATKYIMPASTVPVVDNSGKLTAVWLNYFKAIEDISKHLRFGSGTPQNVESADIGTLYLRENGGASTVLYVKEADTGEDTGWQAK